MGVVRRADAFPELELWRQTDFFNAADAGRVELTTIGCGGIGSTLVPLAAKMGIRKITVYDHDTIETHNIPNQMYRLGDIGRPKLDALKDVCREFAGCVLDTRQEKVTRDHVFTGLVVSGVDSMAARKEIWEAVKNNPQIPLYIEARTGGEVTRIHAVHPCDRDEQAWYETKLYSDEKALPLPCTGMAILYNLFSTAALLGRHIAKFARGEEVPREVIFDIKTLTLLVPKGTKRN